VLQSVAECCRVLQCVRHRAVFFVMSLLCVAACCGVLQCAAVCCSVVQHVAVCCSMYDVELSLWCVAMCCSVLQRVAMCYGVLLIVRHEIVTLHSSKCAYVYMEYIHIHT